MSGQRSRGSVAEYQADEQAGVAGHLFPLELCSVLDLLIFLTWMPACNKTILQYFAFRLYIYNTFIMSPKFLGFLSV